MFVLPRLTIPAASSESVTASDTSGTKSVNAADPKVVRTPAVRFRSLIAVGTPYNGPAPSGTGSSESASASARSGVRVTNAPTSSARAR